jgi:autotransporter-associated beta strand protein
MNGTSGGTSTTKGGSISFDTGTFNVVDMRLAVGTSGTSAGSICGTFTCGSNGNSTGVLNVTNSFHIAEVTGGAANPKGTFNVKGGTANISCNIIDLSTANTSTTTVALTGGTLNMNGFAIGPNVAAGNTGAVGTRHLTTITFPTNSAVLANLGGTGINDAGLSYNGTGTLILEGSNGYIGGTTITSGALQVGQNGDTTAIVLPLGAIANGVTNNSILSLGCAVSATIPNVVSGTGSVLQTGSGTSALTANNTYTGITSVNRGTLRVGNLTNGGSNSTVGASTSAASNLVLSGGTLQYFGSGATTDRLFTVTATGGAIDSSGVGSVMFTNAAAVAVVDPAARTGTLASGSAKITLPNVADLVVGMSVTGTNIPPGTTIISITPTANSITLSNALAFTGADTVSFSTVDRTFTLSGTNTGKNTLGSSLTNSPGATLSVTKSGSGAWRLTAPNTYTGVTTVQAGTLTAIGSPAWMPALGNSNITGGRLVFDYNADVSPAPAVQTALTSSFGTGFSTGALRSSVANTSKGLGWKDDGALKTVTVMFTYFGDANLDGQVNSGDFTLLAQNFNSPGIWATGDFNYDGVVNALDFNAVASNFGAPALPAAAALGSLVPEPGMAALLAIAGMSLQNRRRRLS